MEEKPTVDIPEDIAEEFEDDLNFATSATSENLPYATCLSPPPFKRTHSSSTVSAPATSTNDSSMTLTAHLVVNSQAATSEEETGDYSLEAEREPATSSMLMLPEIDLAIPRSRFSISTMGSVEDLASPQSPYDELPSFYDSNDDDDVLSSNGDLTPFQALSMPGTRKQSMDQGMGFAGYSLPQALSDGKKLEVPTAYGNMGSPALIARSDAGIPLGNTSLLAAPADSGLDDLVSELGWMVDAINCRAA
jgi:hypothetical protein